jgi:hypothetical protein
LFEIKHGGSNFKNKSSRRSKSIICEKCLLTQIYSLPSTFDRHNHFLDYRLLINLTGAPSKKRLLVSISKEIKGNRTILICFLKAPRKRYKSKDHAPNLESLEKLYGGIG